MNSKPSVRTALNLNPKVVAEAYIERLKIDLRNIGTQLRVVGFIASDDLPSLTYAKATKQQFEEAGIDYQLQSVKRLELEDQIMQANADDSIHGMFIYFPVFSNQQDAYLRNLVDYRKDIEAGSLYWTRKLYSNDRLAMTGQQHKKALIPCTPLAIIKMLTAAGIYKEYKENVTKPIKGKIATIFNRSEVIGRPLAVMLSNDGASVYSFDINGALLFENAKPSETNISRKQALEKSDIVITGVPSSSFEKVSAREIKPGTACVNFSTFANFADDVNTHTDIYIPRVGPMTVAMCMRNTVRIYKNFHS